MIAAPKSGSGKTMITCALLQALRNRGEKALSYKCGPDYIDPMFHEKALGVPAGNLDTFFTDEEETRKILADSAKEENIVVMEGVMGLFDGLGGSREEGSSYHLAKVTKTPVILAADVKGMGVCSMIPLLAGRLETTVSVSAIMKIVESAEDLDVDEKCLEEKVPLENKPVIAVAKDEAFCFYYRENLMLLKKTGQK